MFTTARRHGLPLPSPAATSTRDRQNTQDQPAATSSKKKDKPPALSAPPTPSNHAHASAYAGRPATAAAAPASFSRATGRPLAHGQSQTHVRPLTAGGATHLPSSVPQTFPTPAPSPSLSPLSTQAPLRLAMPRAPASACATPSPLSSGLPSPTLPPLPASHFSSVQTMGQAQEKRPPMGFANAAATPAHLRSPIINIGTASPMGHHGRKLSRDEFDYRTAARPPQMHTRQFSVSTSSESGTGTGFNSSPDSPNSPSDAAASPASRGSSGSVREDVLSPGDRVGAGLMLHGEVMRHVFSESEASSSAVELEVVRRLGAGSYAVVYLVREVLRHPPTGILDGLNDLHHSGSENASTTGHYGDKVDDLEMDLWDSSDVDLDMEGIELDGMRRKRRKSVTGDVDVVYHGKEYAVKVLSKAGMDDEALEAQLVEASIHQSLPPHPNIVTLHRALETSGFLFLVLEYVPGEDLYYFLEQARDHYEPEPPSSGVVSSESEGEDSGKRHKANTSVLSVNSVNTVGTMNTTRTPPTPSLLSTLNEKQLLGRRRLRLIASMFAQMCEAVAVCHDVGVYHRDIKPENFIVTDGWEDDGERRAVVVKLTDFGLSTRDAASSDMDCGSAPYMSYECRNNCAPTYAPRAADVWSLGIVLINMLYHINPWTDTTQGVCPSFSAFLAAPEHFFMQRFAGMVPSVASFLCQRVFCILPSEDPSDSAGRRVSARELGQWARELPRLMATEEPVGVPPALSDAAVSTLAFPASSVKYNEKEAEREGEKEMLSPTSPSSTLLAQSLAAVLAQQEAAAAAGSSSPAWRHKRGLSNASVGYALSSVPQSRRPASRQQSFSAERAPHLGLPGVSGLGSTAGSRAATPLLRGRALGSAGPRSRAPSSCETPGTTTFGVVELPTVFDEGEGDISGGSLGLELGLGRERAGEKDRQIDEILEQNEQERIEQYQDNDQEQYPENEHGQDGEDSNENEMSRSTSLVRRRKRGARRGKGQIIQQQQMEIARLQQQQSELARQVQIMQEQLQKQQTKAQVQVLSSLNSTLTSPSLPSPLAQQQSPTLPHIQQAQNGGPADALDSLASASEALARELSRTRNARGSGSSPSLAHAHSFSHLQPSSPSQPHPLSQSQTFSHSHSPTSTTHSVSSASGTNQGANLNLGADDNVSAASLSSSSVPMRTISSSSKGTRDTATLSSKGSKGSTTQASPAAAMAFAGAGGPTPGAMFPVSFASPARTGSAGSVAKRSQNSTSTKSSSVKESVPTASSASASSSATAAPGIAKKTSKWKLSFGKGSSTAHSRAPLPPQIREQVPPVETIDITADAVAVKDEKDDGADARQSESGSAQHGASSSHTSPTASRVKNVLMSLDADISTGGKTSSAVASTSSGANANEMWSRGRKQQPWSLSTTGSGNNDRWSNVDSNGGRNVSPNSTRTGRSGHLSSSASSVSHSSGSSNWRHSTLTTSSATSGWTRYSNGSMRSVSTVATSVSGTGSWRNGNASNASLSSAERKAAAGGAHYHGGPPSLASRNSDKSSLAGVPPPNVKIMTGVPWALDELPRQLHPNPSGDIFGMPPTGPRKQRVRKPKDLPTISERPGHPNNHTSASTNNNGGGPYSGSINSRGTHAKSPLSQRLDAGGRSSTELTRSSGEGEESFGGVEERDRADGAPRKVQKGQINALAKMLSALRR